MNRCTAAVAMADLASLPAAAADRPNVVIFLADDLGYGDLGCYGHPRVKNPNLDAFAKEGVRLTQCYAASAVCSPSRSAILTGRCQGQQVGIVAMVWRGEKEIVVPPDIGVRCKSCNGTSGAVGGKVGVNTGFPRATVIIRGSDLAMVIPRTVFTVNLAT